MELPEWLMFFHVLAAIAWAGSSAPLPASWPSAGGRLLEGIPIVSSDLMPAVRRGGVAVKPAIDRLVGERVRFADGSEEVVDRIVYATGYRISVPFLSPSLISGTGREFPLFRPVVHPGIRGLFFAGFVDAPGGLLPVVETQADWIAAVLAGSLPPATARPDVARDASRRTAHPAALPDRGSVQHSMRPARYRRLLRSDLRRARLRGKTVHTSARTPSETANDAAGSPVSEIMPSP